MRPHARPPSRRPRPWGWTKLRAGQASPLGTKPREVSVGRLGRLEAGDLSTGEVQVLEHLVLGALAVQLVDGLHVLLQLAGRSKQERAQLARVPATLGQFRE